MNRRNFLQKSMIATAGSVLLPNILHAQGGSESATLEGRRNLVLIHLSGGNDGLNTIVPYENDVYYKLRPNIAIPKKEVIKLGSDQGFNPALAALRPLFENGQMSILNNVGYPQPHASHFRATEIWHSGDAQNSLETGWIGRYLDHINTANPKTAIDANDHLSLLLKGTKYSGLTYKDAIQKTESNSAFSLFKRATFAPDYLKQQFRKYSSKVQYPNTAFASQLHQIGHLINTRSESQIYNVSLDGFDTHTNQKPQQDRLLKEYADGLLAFIDDLKNSNRFNDTLILTYSEFGRSVRENASKGTDHGAANCIFLHGGALNEHGILNDGPSLTDLEDGQLKHKIDFRQVYASIIDQWLEADHEIILGRQFEKLAFV